MCASITATKETALVLSSKFASMSRKKQCESLDALLLKAFLLYAQDSKGKDICAHVTSKAVTYMGSYALSPQVVSIQ